MARKKITSLCFFEETIHQIFDDYDLAEILEEHKKYEISEQQLALLEKFMHSLDEYSEEKMSWLYEANPQEIINDPKWHKIQKLAKEGQKIFNYTPKRR